MIILPCVIDHFLKKKKEMLSKNKSNFITHFLLPPVSLDAFNKFVFSWVCTLSFLSKLKVDTCSHFIPSKYDFSSLGINQ